MKLFTLRYFTLLLTFLCLTATVQSVVAMPTQEAPARTTTNAPVRIQVRMFQDAQAVEILWDNERNDANAKVVITNIIGKTVLVTPIELQAGDASVRVEVGSLPQGTYILQVQGNGWTSEARKFVKANP
jgi:hypothetical protein